VRPPRPAPGEAPGRRVLWLVVLVGLAADTVVAARSHPFTWAANVTTAVALAVLLGVVALQRLAPSSLPDVVRRRRPVPDEVVAAWGARWVVWPALLAAVVGWELFCFVSTPRAAHPTLSSVLDSVTSGAPGRGLAFAAWLVVGWFAVTR